jgi:hypothetical protein
MNLEKIDKKLDIFSPNELKAFNESKIDTNYKSDNGDTLLTMACVLGMLNWVKHLYKLDMGKINEINDKSDNILILSVKYHDFLKDEGKSNYKCIKYIVENTNVNINYLNDRRYSAFTFACKINNFELANLFLNNNLTVYNIRTSSNKLPISYITEKKMDPIVLRILSSPNKKKKIKEKTKIKDFKKFDKDEFTFLNLKDKSEGSYGVTLPVILNSTNEKLMLKKYKDCDNTLIDKDSLKDIYFIRKINEISEKCTVTLYGITIINRCIYLVMEMLTYTMGDIAKIYENINFTKGKKEFYKDIFYLLLKHLNILCSCGIMHSDIKSENIMIDNENYPRIIDYGLAVFLGIGPKLDILSNYRGTQYTKAPDYSVKNTDFNVYLDGKYIELKNNYINYTTDVYSLAQVFMENIFPNDLHSRTYTFINDKLYYKGHDQKKYTSISQDYIDILDDNFPGLYNLICKMTHYDSNLRFNAGKCLKHYFFTINKKYLENKPPLHNNPIVKIVNVPKNNIFKIKLIPVFNLKNETYLDINNCDNVYNTYENYKFESVILSENKYDDFKILAKNLTDLLKTKDDVNIDNFINTIYIIKKLLEKNIEINANLIYYFYSSIFSYKYNLKKLFFVTVDFYIENIEKYLDLFIDFNPYMKHEIKIMKNNLNSLKTFTFKNRKLILTDIDHFLDKIWSFYKKFKNSDLQSYVEKIDYYLTSIENYNLHGEFDENLKINELKFNDINEKNLNFSLEVIENIDGIFLFKPVRLHINYLVSKLLLSLEDEMAIKVYLIENIINFYLGSKKEYEIKNIVINYIYLYYEENKLPPPKWNYERINYIKKYPHFDDTYVNFVSLYSIDDFFNINEDTMLFNYNKREIIYENIKKKRNNLNSNLNKYLDDKYFHIIMLNDNFTLEEIKYFMSVDFTQREFILELNVEDEDRSILLKKINKVDIFHSIKKYPDILEKTYKVLFEDEDNYIKHIPFINKYFKEENSKILTKLLTFLNKTRSDILIECFKILKINKVYILYILDYYLKIMGDKNLIEKCVISKITGKELLNIDESILDVAIDLFKGDEKITETDLLSVNSFVFENENIKTIEEFLVELFKITNNMEKLAKYMNILSLKQTFTLKGSINPYSSYIYHKYKITLYDTKGYNKKEKFKFLEKEKKEEKTRIKSPPRTRKKVDNDPDDFFKFSDFIDENNSKMY